MISLKAIQSLTPNHGRRRLVLSLCTSNNSGNPSDGQTPPPEENGRKQELLARIAMLQTHKVRLTGYLDDRSAYPTQFAEEANAEIDQIGNNALRQLDQAGARIMGSIDSQMQAFEESVESDKLEIGENEKKAGNLEHQIEKYKNEWLSLKTLRERTPVDKAKAKENAGSVIRRNIYAAVIGLVVIGIADATIALTSDWRKIALLGVILPLNLRIMTFDCRFYFANCPSHSTSQYLEKRRRNPGVGLPKSKAQALRRRVVSTFFTRLAAFSQKSAPGRASRRAVQRFFKHWY